MMTFCPNTCLPVFDNPSNSLQKQKEGIFLLARSVSEALLLKIVKIKIINPMLRKKSLNSLVLSIMLTISTIITEEYIINIVKTKKNENAQYLK